MKKEHLVQELDYKTEHKMQTFILMIWDRLMRI
jgi:hypothetical protein